MRDYADNRMADEGRRPARKPEMARATLPIPTSA